MIGIERRIGAHLLTIEIGLFAHELAVLGGIFGALDVALVEFGFQLGKPGVQVLAARLVVIGQDVGRFQCRSLVNFFSVTGVGTVAMAVIGCGLIAILVVVLRVGLGFLVGDMCLTNQSPQWATVSR